MWLKPLYNLSYPPAKAGGKTEAGNSGRFFSTNIIISSKKFFPQISFERTLASGYSLMLTAFLTLPKLRRRTKLLFFEIANSDKLRHFLYVNSPFLIYPITKPITHGFGTIFY